ncbi:MAG: alpha-amylase [Chitinophagaceae bacterium]|nr:alpha-amylase [Chitinophagaceae bacterium]
MILRNFLLLLIITSSNMAHAQIERPGAAKITAEESVQRNLRHRVFYEIFVRSFYDSNNDGIGDLNGITMQLDYLASLGIGGLWLTPFHPSPSYHKYDVVNYLDVDPEYGTLDDFKRLVAEAHKRNILVLTDLVINHTSSEHPWFQAALKDDPQFKKYYNWETSPDKSEKNWHLPKQTNQLASGEKYYGFFSPVMPDLNYDNEEVRDTIIAIGKWWLKETEIDGYRLDAAQFIFGEEDTLANNKWWKQFTDELKTVKPDVITIGEVWNKKSFVATYTASLSGAFNFELSWELLKLLQEEKNELLIENLLATKELYAAHSAYYIDPIFLSNHDVNRIISDLKNNIEKAKLAAAIYLTLPGTPFIYYGEELGMRGMKPDELIREPFLWNSKGRDIGQPRWQKPKYSKSNQVKPLALQQEDANSMFNTYKKLITTRQTFHALSSAEIKPVSTATDEILIYERGESGRSVLVIHNLTDERMTYAVPASYTSFKRIVYQSSPKINVNETGIELPAYGTILLSVN